MITIRPGHQFDKVHLRDFSEHTEEVRDIFKDLRAVDRRYDGLRYLKLAVLVLGVIAIRFFSCLAVIGASAASMWHIRERIECENDLERIRLFLHTKKLPIAIKSDRKPWRGGTKHRFYRLVTTY